MRVEISYLAGSKCESYYFAYELNPDICHTFTFRQRQREVLYHQGAEPGIHYSLLCRGDHLRKVVSPGYNPKYVIMLTVYRIEKIVHSHIP